jgi:hypothetical protein
VEAFTPTGSESYIKTESHPLLHTKPAAPCPGKNLLRQKEIVRENTGPQQSTTNKKKIHTHLKTMEKKTTAKDQPRPH